MMWEGSFFSQRSSSGVSVFDSHDWRTGSRTRHHHFMRPLSSRTCLPRFSMLPGKRYWFCERAKRETTSWRSFRLRLSTRWEMKVEEMVRRGEAVPLGSLSRWR